MSWITNGFAVTSASALSPNAKPAPLFRSVCCYQHTSLMVVWFIHFLFWLVGCVVCCMQCLSCLKANGPSHVSYFCSEQCLRQAWPTHRLLHQKAQVSANDSKAIADLWNVCAIPIPPIASPPLTHRLITHHSSLITHLQPFHWRIDCFASKTCLLIRFVLLVLCFAVLCCGCAVYCNA
jgi:hypothetical protein